MASQDDDKRAAARRAAALVRDGMVVGLGTGTTAELFVRSLAERVATEKLGITGVPTSRRTRGLAEQLGIPLCPPETVPVADLTVDGTDEVDDALRLIKGAGGALLYEKIVAAASRAMVVIADASKRVRTLGAVALPVEVVEFGWERTAARIAETGGRFASAPPEIRRRGGASGPTVTDGGHFILDCRFGAIHDAAGLAALLDGLPGVVEHGLFLELASAAILASDGNVEILGKLP